jgi:hypothetical protein
MKMEVKREPFTQPNLAGTLPDYVVNHNATSNAAALNRRIEIILIY